MSGRTPAGNRRSRPRKRNVKKKVPNNKQLATRIKKLEHSDELKFRDFYDVSDWYNSTSVFALSNIPQGDDVNERVGQEIQAKYVNIKLQIQRNAGVAALPIRCILFWDTQADGNPPTLLSSSDAATALLNDDVIGTTQLMPFQYATKQRYHVLMDKIVYVNPASSTTTSFKLVKKNFMLGGAKVKYATSAGSITAASSRVLYLYCWAGGAAGLGGGSYRATARFWYTDS